jgi:hypothetical protein
LIFPFDVSKKHWLIVFYAINLSFCLPELVTFWFALFEVVVDDVVLKTDFHSIILKNTAWLLIEDHLSDSIWSIVVGCHDHTSFKLTVDV